MALSYDILRNRDFRLLLSTRFFGTMAMQAQAVIVGWQIYSLTHSAFLLGLAGLLEAIPALTCGFFAGHMVDTHRPYRIFLLCVSGLVLNMLYLFLMGSGLILAPGPQLVPWLFAGVFVSGAVRSFIMPSSFALQAQIVPRHQMPAAAAWLSSFFQIAAVSGPAIAGLIYGGYGAHTAWLMPVSFMSIEFILVCAISRNHRKYRSSQQREPIFQSIAAGWRFVIHNRILLPVMALDMFAVLFGGAVAVLPVFADQVLHLGSEGLGLLRAAPAIGSIMTALYFAVKPMKNIRGSVLLAVITGFGACMLGFGLSTAFLPAAIFLALSGSFDSVSMVIRGTLMQLLIPDTMRGRVSALNSMFIISSNEIGAFESGTAASLLGLVPSIIFGGCMTLLIVGITAATGRELRKVVVHSDKKEEAP